MIKCKPVYLDFLGCRPSHGVSEIVMCCVCSQGFSPNSSKIRYSTFSTGILPRVTHQLIYRCADLLEVFLTIVEFVITAVLLSGHSFSYLMCKF